MFLQAEYSSNIYGNFIVLFFFFFFCSRHYLLNLAHVLGLSDGPEQQSVSFAVPFVHHIKW